MYCYEISSIVMHGSLALIGIFVIAALAVLADGALMADQLAWFEYQSDVEEEDARREPVFAPAPACQEIGLATTLPGLPVCRADQGLLTARGHSTFVGRPPMIRKPVFKALANHHRLLAARKECA